MNKSERKLDFSLLVSSPPDKPHEHFLHPLYSLPETGAQKVFENLALPFASSLDFNKGEVSAVLFKEESPKNTSSRKVYELFLKCKLLR